MKYVYLILTIAFLTSCGNQKIRLRRVQSKSQTVLKINDDERKNVRAERKAKSDKNEILTPAITEEVFSTAVDEVKEETNKTIIEKIHKNNPTKEIPSSTDDEKVAQAIKSEKHAKAAAGILIAALPGFFLLLLPGVILFIVGAIYYRKAKKATYISEKGSRALSLARVFFIIDLILTSALLIGIAGIVINSLL